MTKEKDWINFCELMNMAAEMVNCGKKSEDAIGLMFKMLSQYQFNTISSALEKHLTTSKFFPTPADLIEKIKVSVADKALLAWHSVKKSVARYGKYNPVQFNDPCIHFAIYRLGGWDVLCGKTEDEMVWVGKEFVEVYQLGVEKGIDWKSPGVPEVFNAKLQNNIVPVEIKYIGFKDPPVKALPDKQNEMPLIDFSKIVKGF